MPVPSSYTEQTLAAYMVASLGEIAAILGITSLAMTEAVTDVAIACGVSDIADASDIAQVRALAKVAALRRAQTVTAGWYDFAVDGGDYKRSQVMAQLSTMLADAEQAAMVYDTTYAMETGSLRYTNDPYDWDAVNADE